MDKYTVLAVVFCAAAGGWFYYSTSPTRNPLVAGAETTHPLVATMTSSDEKNVSIELELDHGAKLCGPAYVVGWVGENYDRTVLFHIPANQCIGGTRPKWEFPQPVATEAIK